MPEESIKEILMRRDGISEKEADELITNAREDLDNRLVEGKMASDICEEWFGLEPDYLEELIN